MPESKVRKTAAEKKKVKDAAELAEKRADSARLMSGSRNWVPYVFVPLFLLGVLWMVVYNLAGADLGFMRAIGDWNVAIGLGLIIAIPSMIFWRHFRALIDSFVIDMEQQAIKLVEVAHGERRD